VTNIVNEWRQALGLSAADELRELADSLKKIGISAAQCADGFRAAMIMNSLGVTEDSFESFMSDIYKRLQQPGANTRKHCFLLDKLDSVFKDCTVVSDIGIHSAKGR
jgi:hypothetical protein